MTKTTLIIGVGALVGTYVLSKLGKMLIDADKLSKTRASETIERDRAKEDRDLFYEYDLAKTRYNLVVDVEKKNLETYNAISREKLDYDNKMNDYRNEYAAAKRNAKSLIKYNQRVSEISKEKEQAMDAYKKSINYDSEIKNLNNKIASEKRDYERAKTLADICGKDDDSTEAMKKAAKKVKKDKISKYENEIETLKSRVSDKKTELDSEACTKMTLLDKEYNDLIKDAEKTRNIKIQALREEYNALRERNKNIVLNGRTDADKEDLAKYPIIKARYEDLIERESSAAYNLYSSFSKLDNFAYYLAKNNYSITTVRIVGLIPVGIAAAGCLAYICKLNDFIKLLTLYKGDFCHA